MLIEAIALLVIGTIAALLPLSAAYRSHLTHRLAKRARASVPSDKAHMLEAQLARRAWGFGGGVVLAGLVMLAWALLRPGGSDTATGGTYVVLSAMFVFGAAGLTVVEILWPGRVTQGPRTARASAPVLADYLPPQMRLAALGLPLLGLLVLLTALGLAWSPWFDAGTIWRSPVPLLAAAIPFLAILSMLGVRAVLEAPQRSSDEADLFWRDLLRASTLSSLTIPTALVGIFGIITSAYVLDDAASVVAQAQGQVGPAWSLWLLIVGYGVPPLLALAALVATSRGGGDEIDHTRDRLWGGRTLGTTTHASGA